LSGARRADVTGFGVPEHHGDGSALPMVVQSGNLSLEIWSSGGCRVKSRIALSGTFIRDISDEVLRHYAIRY
jgi:hypothetical protein